MLLRMARGDDEAAVEVLLFSPNVDVKGPMGMLYSYTTVAQPAADPPRLMLLGTHRRVSLSSSFLLLHTTT